MELTILNSSFEIIGIIDTFTSLIWTDRYYDFGDFEFSKSPDLTFITLLNQGSYLALPESEHLMVIENIHIRSSIEEGNSIIVKGRSLESILDRRIIWSLTSLVGDFQDGILQLLTENAIDPTDEDRQITLLEFEVSTDPSVTDLTISSQFTGTSLYKVILDLCIERNVGFKIILTGLGKLQFSLYNGIDRSYDQEINPYVVFSPNFDNLINSDYDSLTDLFKTVALVAGEGGIGNVRRGVVVTLSPDGGSDLNRREIFTDASDITRTTDGESLSNEEYDALLAQRGMEELAQNTILEEFNGQADITRTYIYGEDFFMGDILQIANEYGKEGKARLVELIRSQDPSGIKIYPKFTMITN